MLITGSSDSKILDLSSFNSTHAQSAYMRLRLEVAFRLLTNSQILMPEGWALDSLPFLKVANEVLRAARAVRNRSDAPDGIHEFDPFVMEVRASGGYLGALHRYMVRADTRWSGFGPLRGDLERQALIAETASNAIKSGSGFRGELLIPPMAEVLGREDVPEAMAEVASYFSRREHKRIINVEPYPDEFRQGFEKLIAFLHDQTPFDDKTAEIGEPLILFAKELRLRDVDLSSSSPLMRFAENATDEPTRDAIFHVINFVYMSVSADAVGAAVVAPPVQPEAMPIVHLADALTEKIRGSSQSCGKLDFGDVSAIHPRLLEKLGSQDWQDVWEPLIALSLSKEWRKRFGAVCEQYRRGHSGEKLATTRAVKEANDLLEKECPCLVLKESGVERLGLQLDGARLDILKGVWDRGIQSGAGYVLAEAVITGTGIIGGVAGMLGGPVVTEISKPMLPETRRFGINPFGREGFWSSRSTLFDAAVKSTRPDF